MNGICIVSGSSEKIGIVFSDGHVEYFDKSKLKTGSTTTKPFIPVCANVYTKKTFGKTNGKGTTVYFNENLILDNSNSLGETTGNTSANSKNNYLPFLCKDLNTLKNASFRVASADSYGTSYSVTYTMWIEE